MRATMVRGASLASGGFFATQVIVLGSYIVLAHLAPPRVFGIFAAAGVIAALGTIVVESGMTAALIHRSHDLEAAAATAFVSTLAVGVAFGFVVAATAPLLGFFFHNAQIGYVAASMSAMPLLEAATVVPDALMQRRFSFVRRLFIDPTQFALYGIVAAVGLSMGLRWWSLVIAQYAAAVVRVALVWMLAAFRPRVTLASWLIWRELARYARFVVASELMREGSRLVTTSLIGRALGPAALGQYGFAWRIAGQVTTPVVTAGNIVLFPSLARISDDPERLGPAFLRSLRSLAVVFFPLTFALAPFGPAAARLLFGREWTQAGDILTALAGASASIALIATVAEAFKAVGRPDLMTRAQALVLVVPTVLGACGLPFGSVGVAAGVSVGFVLVAGHVLTKAGHLLSLTPRQTVSALLPQAFAAGLVALATLVIDRQFVHAADLSELRGLAAVALEAALALVAYVLLARLIAPSAIADVRESLQVLRRRRAN
jgi:O-antigen/teichoic acid export membrane protein